MFRTLEGKISKNPNNYENEQVGDQTGVIKRKWKNTEAVSPLHTIVEALSICVILRYMKRS